MKNCISKNFAGTQYFIEKSANQIKSRLLCIVTYQRKLSLFTCSGFSRKIPLYLEFWIQIRPDPDTTRSRYDRILIRPDPDTTGVRYNRIQIQPNSDTTEFRYNRIQIQPNSDTTGSRYYRIQILPDPDMIR